MIAKIKDLVLIIFFISLIAFLGIAFNEAMEDENNDGYSDYFYYLADALEESYAKGFLKEKIDYDDPVLNLRKIFLVTDFDEKQAEELISKLAYLDNKDPGVPIDIYIETSGGSGAGPVTLFIQTMKSPVNTYAFDWCNSAGACLLVSGTGTRYAFKNSRISIHALGLDEEDERDDEEYSYNEQFEYSEKQFWSNLTKVPSEIYGVKDDTYFYLSSEEALNLGLIDEILDYKMKISDRKFSEEEMPESSN
jgi:ATP-dependent Clp protease protease subunit